MEGIEINRGMRMIYCHCTKVCNWAGTQFVFFYCRLVVYVGSKGFVLVAGAWDECYRMSELCQRDAFVSCCFTGI